MLRAAIIGTGFMGWVHAEALRRLRVPVVGILGSTPEKSKAIAARLQIERAYGTFEEVLADDTVQVLHIVTPNRYHFEMARRGLESNRHVLCEKPLAMSSSESEQLVRLAEQRPRLAAGVNYNIRFYPLCVEVRERIQKGDLGELIHVTGSYVQDWLLKPTDYNWRVLAEEGELRAMADIGTHWFDLIQVMTGLQVESVCADLQTFHTVRYRPKGEVETYQDRGDHSMEPIDVRNDDFGVVISRFEAGVRGGLHVSQVTAGRKNCLRFEIAGSEQAVSWNSESPNKLWIGHRDRPNELLTRDPSLMGPTARETAEYPGGHNEGYADSFKQCFRAFYEHIENDEASGRRAFPTFADGHREIVLCEAILASHRERKWINL